MRKSEQRTSKNATTHPVDDLPGLGIVRIRSLRKAGYETIESLREASEEQLATVPGITPIKAKQILQQLNGTTHELAPSARAVSVAPPSAPSLGSLEPAFLSAARRISAQATALLSANASSELERRLARQLGRAALAADHIVANDRLHPVAGKKLTSILVRLNEILDDFAADGQFGHRKQEKLADRLRTARKDAERELASALKKANSRVKDE